MKRSLTYKIAFALVVLFFFTSLNAQEQNASSENKQRIDDYLELLKLGYSEIEIFQDLGNVNFLTENYKTATFWYEKLFEIAQAGSIPTSYKERYNFAMSKVSGSNASDDRDWLAVISEDYSLKKTEASNSIVTASKTPSSKNNFKPTMSITQNGSVAFFSQAVQEKPEYGIFSKPETVHEIYRAEKINGKWRNIEKVAVCPKHYSAKHPTVSADGSRLFFASNMPGTYGKYDIYVADITSDGSVGIAKNLGPKVNTKKDDLYPSLSDDSLLLFASDGRKGYGGLDLFAVQVSKNSVSRSINLGKEINSSFDEFALSLAPENGMGYVMTNRGSANSVTEVAVRFSKSGSGVVAEKNENELMKVLNDKTETDYSSTVFEN